MKPAGKTIPLAAAALGFLAGGTAVFLATRSWQRPPSAAGGHQATPNDDAALVRSLLAENLTERSFDFATIAEASSGKRVLPLEDTPAQRRVIAAIERALAQTLADLNKDSSPVRKLRRINEASKFFEDGILATINSMPGFRCEVPPTKAGGQQRAGYPDLRITDAQSGLVFYLDPKLVEQGSAESTFRSFYFEPKNETLKITDDAVHLIAGIEHDGKDSQWTFTGWRLVDLSKLRVRLKAEFQASNADLYQNSAPPPPPDGR